VLTASYGTYVGTGDKAGAELRDEIVAAEQGGYYAVFFSEHHATPGYPPSPLALASYALGATSVLRSGPMPLLLPLHDPIRVAEETALIDHVSGGRLVLGVAPGYLPADFSQVGLPLDERGARCDEALTIIRRMWQGDSHEFTGRFHTVHGDQPLPYPAYQGRIPPVWMASSSVAGMRRAIRWNARIVIDSVQPQVEVERLAALYRALCADQNAQAQPVAVIRRGWFGDDGEVAAFAGAYGAELERYLRMVGASNGPGAASLRASCDSTEAVAQRIVAGAPEQVADSLTEWAARAGIDHVIMKMQWGMPDHAKLMTQLARAGRFNERLAAS
jgi:alkanesulfonate monooxygenase SsuD/methylene tetrahydromethanopterin reductase-like flavin-dependent oxidoreductase (luciferase family)